MPVRNPPISTGTASTRSALANVRTTNASSANATAARTPRPTPAISTVTPVRGTTTSRERQMLRAPPVITESSMRRNRITLLSSRRRTSLATSTTSRPSEATVEGNAEPSSENAPRRVSLSTYTPLFSSPRASSPAVRRVRSRHQRAASMSAPSLVTDPVARVLSSEKYLPKILQFLNWNELLPARRVCKKWQEVVTSDPLLENRTGVITIRNSWEEKLEIFNSSPVVWTKFRIQTNMFIDLMDSCQLQFWMKHGPTMTFLEIRNNSMTLSGLVEILSRCPNLEHFLVSWTPEMYSFNPELIQRYYGIKFYNGNFANMKELIVENSSYLTDSGLWSMLKWCSGPLRSLQLIYAPEDQQNPLTRLKPRWTIQPLQNYLERFGYTGNLCYLNFAWSNLSPKDLMTLAEIGQLSSLKGITLSNCKLNDYSLIHFLKFKGKGLEHLKIDNVPITQEIFAHSEFPRLKSLDISGGTTSFLNLNFLKELPALEEFSASSTTWLNYEMLMKPLKAIVAGNHFLKIDIGGSSKINGIKHIDSNMNRVWFTSLASSLSKVVSVNLSHWGHFGKNENFRVICQSMPLLEELRLRGWKDLSDAGVTGLPAEKLHQSNVLIVSKEHKNRMFVGSLKHLHLLDLSGSSISDVSIKYGIQFIPFLRKFAFDDTQITDAGIKQIVEKIGSIDRISTRGCERISNRKTKYQRPDGRYIFVDKI